MRSALPVLLLGACASVSAFLAPHAPLRSPALASTQLQRVGLRCQQHCPRFGTASVRMCQDNNDKIDDELKKITDARGSSLDKAIEDDEQYKAMAMEAAKKRVEELKAKAMNMPKPPERKSDVVESPSFISQTVNQAEKEAQAEAEAEEEKQIERKKAFEGVEVDPRGFIVPQIGDIVLCPGKWANEDMVALVEDTQFVDARMSWNVDVIELSAVGPSLYGRSFSAWKKPIKRWESAETETEEEVRGEAVHTQWEQGYLTAEEAGRFDVSEVRPARAEYVEDQDAWRVENARDYINNPVVVNETARTLGLAEYSELKKKIVTDTAVLGLAGSGGLALYDQSLASSFAIGALSSIAYIALLATKVEEVGPEGSPNAGLPLLSPRFLAPLGLFVALYVKFTQFMPVAQMSNGLPRIPPPEIAAAALGFLCYKLPLLYESSRQVALTMDDTAEALEKGVGEGYKQWQVRVKDNVREARERESRPETSINPFTKIRLTVEQQYKEKEERERREREDSE